MLSALRNYLVRQLTSERCEVTSPTNIEIAEAFKQAIRGRSDITSITADEMKAGKHEGNPIPLMSIPLSLPLRADSIHSHRANRVKTSPRCTHQRRGGTKPSSCSPASKLRRARLDETR